MKNTMICLLCLIMLASVLSVPAFAEDAEIDDWTLETEELPQEEQDAILKNIIFMITDNMQPRGMISCFAAAADGSVAIGMDVEDVSAVHVLDAQGEYLYTVRFDIHGAYSLGWHQEDHTLLIRIIRSDSLVSVGADRSVSVQRLASTSDNRRQVDERFSRKQSVGNCRYSLENSLGFFNFLLLPVYSRLVAAEGNETRILYEADSSWVQDKVISSVVAWIAWIGAAVWVTLTIRGIIKRKRAEEPMKKTALENEVEIATDYYLK